MIRRGGCPEICVDADASYIFTTRQQAALIISVCCVVLCFACLVPIYSKQLIAALYQRTSPCETAADHDMNLPHHKQGTKVKYKCDSSDTQTEPDQTTPHHTGAS